MCTKWPGGYIGDKEVSQERVTGKFIQFSPPQKQEWWDSWYYSSTGKGLFCSAVVTGKGSDMDMEGGWTKLVEGWAHTFPPHKIPAYTNCTLQHMSVPLVINTDRHIWHNYCVYA